MVCFARGERRGLRGESSCGDETESEGEGEARGPETGALIIISL